MMRALVRDVVALVVLLALAAFCLKCGGDAFTSSTPAPDAGDVLEGGDVLEVLDGQGGDGATLVNLDHVEQLDAGGDVLEVLEAAPQLDAPDEEGHATDASHPVADAALTPDAGPDVQEAGTSFCCVVLCGQGTLRSGFTCSGPCIAGGACTFPGAGPGCGMIEVCP